MKATPTCTTTLLFPPDGQTICRIPSLAVTPAGTVLAFAQQRLGSRTDHGHPSRIVLRRSEDGGATWHAMQTLADCPDTDYHNGPVVVDARSGRVFKFYRKEPASIVHVSTLHDQWDEWTAWGLGSYLITSDDEGATWSEPVLLDTRHPRTVGRNGIGNGIHGVQLPDGRLVVQADAWTDRHWGDPGKHPSLSCLLVSDEGGSRWVVGPSWEVGEAAMEFALAVRQDGTLLVNQRTLGPCRDMRIVDMNTGRVGPARPATALDEPICHAALLHLGPDHLQAPGGILFANPANRNTTGKYQGATRTRLTVRLSRDDGESWPVARVLDPGKAGYCDLAVLPGGDVLCLYENGPEHYNDQIGIARFNLAWLTDRSA